MEVVSPYEQLLFSTVRIETILDAGVQSTGTGFVFSYNTPSGDFPCIVTNKHVVAGAKIGWLTFSQGDKGKPKLGEQYRLGIEDFEDVWHGHPDDSIDVTIAPLAPLLDLARQNDTELFYRLIPGSYIPSKEIVNTLDALEEIVFIGYPNGIWDHVNLLPVIRRGITATPIAVDFQGKKQFLIDASVFPGSSGSPVLLVNMGIYFNKQTSATTIGTRAYFLGIISGVFLRTDLNEIISVPAPTIERQVTISRQMINLGIVFKASTVEEAIRAFLSEKGIALHELS